MSECVDCGAVLLPRKPGPGRPRTLCVECRPSDVPVAVIACHGCGKRFEGRGRAKWCSNVCRRRTLYSGACVDCGKATYNGEATPPERCQRCNGARSGAMSRDNWSGYRQLVEEMWAEGMTVREICGALGSGYSKTRLAQWRSRGYDLPHRRTPEQLARMLVGSDERLARARAIYREQKAEGVHKSAIPCDCGCECMIVWEFEQWGDEPHQVWVDFTVSYPADRLRARLKAAWRVVRRKDPWLHSIVLQDEGLEQFRRAIRCEVQS